MIHRFRRSDCLPDGDLRALLDASVPADHRAAHVDTCERCRARMAELGATAAAVDVALSGLSRSPDAADSTLALAAFRARMAGQSQSKARIGGNWMTQTFGRVPRAVTAIGAALAIVLLLAISPMRTVADDFLSQFRVQKFHAITVSMDDFAPMAVMFAGSLLGEDLDDLKADLDMLGTFETTFNFEDASALEPMTLDEARAAYGDFAVPGNLPAGFTADPQAYVTEAGTASYTVDVARLNDLVRRIGLPIDSLPDPETHPNLTFTLNAPAAVALAYTSETGDVLVAGQMESPWLTIPEGVDMDALREDILRFPGLPDDFVEELRSIEDWENTLIIPIPEGATSRDVTINGDPGLLIESDEGSVVLWEDSGVLFGVAGQVAGDDALNVAKSMR